MKDSYRVLKIVVRIMEILAWCVGGLGVISFFIILIGGGDPGSPRAMSIVALLVGALYFAVLYTAAGIVKILLEIAENTKRRQ